MEQIISCCELIGAWLIFIFPLYQGMLELQEQVQNVKTNEYSKTNVPKISSLYWLWPPLKINLEKKRIFKILNLRQASNEDLAKFLHFLDKATAWFYVALGGLLTAIAVTYNTIENFKFKINTISFWLIIILIIIFTFISNNYRINNVRKQKLINKIREQMKKL